MNFITYSNAPNLEDERVKYIKTYFINNPSGYKMNKLFNEPNKRQMLNLAKFVGEIMQEFKK